MQIKIAKTLGLNSDQKAALALSLPGGDELFLGLVSLECDDAFVRGRQLLSDSADSYFESEENISERLSKLFSEASGKLNDANFSLLLGLVSGKALYLIGKGEVVAYLRRVDKLSPLQVNAAQLVSGFLQEGDRVFLATESLVLLLGEGIKEVVDLPLEAFEDEVASRTAGAESVVGVAIDITPDEGQEEIIIPKSIEENSTTGSPRLHNLLGKINLRKIRPTLPSSGRVRVILAVILILIIATGVGLKFKAIKDSEKDVKFNGLITLARNDYRAAEGLKTLNPAEAILKISSAKESLDQALKLKPTDPEALNLKKQIEENGLSLGQKFESKFSEYLDLELVKKGFRSTRMSLSTGNLLLLNPDDATLVVIDLDKKSQQILAGKEKLGEAKFSSINGDVAFSFASDKGITLINLSSEKASNSAKPDTEWGQIADLYGFGGNIYLLDKSGQIWKYLSFLGGYSDKRKYLLDGVKPDFSNALRMQIESSVYVLKSGGEILRFTRGELDNFSIGGLDKGIKDPKSFFVSSDTDNLYILDSGNSRLVVLNKTGGYVAQYSGDKFGSASDLVVDEEGKKVYLLENSKIYVMDLR